MKCPTCQKDRDLFVNQDYLPFCSDRCRKADLGRWMVGEYRISRPLRMEDEVLMEDIPMEEDSPEEGTGNG